MRPAGPRGRVPEADVVNVAYWLKAEVHVGASGMNKIGTMSLVSAAWILSSCTHAPPVQLAMIEHRECEVIARLAPRGTLKDIAWGAPAESGVVEGYSGTAADARRKQESASLRDCPGLAGRLSASGSQVSRVAFNLEATRAVVEIDCSPSFLRRDGNGPWIEEATYNSVHGCYNIP